MIWAVIWYWLLAVFTTADIITTKLALMHGAHEANPFMVGLVDHIIEVKFVFLLLVMVMVIWLESRKENTAWVPVAGGATVTFVAVVSNIVQLISMMY